MIYVCSATLKNEYEFKEESLLGQFYNKNVPNISFNIKYENTDGLGKVYNQYIENSLKYNDDDILIFCHDDVNIEDLYLEEKLNKALDLYDVVGLAGSSELEIKHPVVWNKAGIGKCFGNVNHTKDDVVWSTNFGKSPKRCLALDGLFLCTTVNNIKKYDLKFDEQFDFHFYDLDFCLTAHKQGAILGVYPINVLHASIGDWTKDPKWYENEDKFIVKWE